MTDKPEEDYLHGLICGHAAALRRRTAIADALVEDLFRRLLKTKYPLEPDEDVPSVPETKGDRRRRLAAEIRRLAASYPKDSDDQRILETKAEVMEALARYADKQESKPADEQP
jgi:hypothetical protein